MKVKKVTVNIVVGEQKKKISESSLKSSTSMVKDKIASYDTSSLLGSVKYDLIAELTRKTIVTILQKISPSTFAKFKVNPENFIMKVSKIINNEKATSLISA